MDFKKLQSYYLCKEYDKPISQIMMDRECEMTEKPLDEIRSRMAVPLQIMKDATKEAINQPSQSMGGLIGGESRKPSDLQSSWEILPAHRFQSDCLLYGCAGSQCFHGAHRCRTDSRLIRCYSGVLLALQEEYDFTDDQIIDALFHLFCHWPSLPCSRNCCRCRRRMSGRNRRCRRNAAAAVVELMGGTPEQCTDAASQCL